MWTWVRAWTARTLEKAGERVADVQGDDDPEELEEPTVTQAAAATATEAGATADTTTTSGTTESEIRKTQ